MTPTPAIQPPTIDTLISSISMFSTVLLALLGLFLTFIGGIGGFLIWRGESYLKKAKEDSKAISDFRIQAAESLRETLKAGDTVVKTADEIVAVASSAKAKDNEFSRLLPRYEQSKIAFSNASQGTATLIGTLPVPPIAKPQNLDEVMSYIKEYQERNK